MGMRQASLAIVQSAVIAVLMALISIQAVYCCAVVAQTQDLAFVYAIGWTCLNLLVNPFMMVYDRYKLQWLSSILQWISASSYAWQGMAYVELHNRGFPCQHAQGLETFGIMKELIPSGRTFNLFTSQMNSMSSDCVADANVVLEFYGATRAFGPTVGILCVYLMVVHAITYCALWRASAKLAVKK